MVNFGGHVVSLLGESSNATQDFFLVPYNDCKRAIHKSSEQFEQAWRSAFDDASADFSQSLQNIWTTVFSQLQDECGDIRGIPLGDALRKYAEKQLKVGEGPEEVLETVKLLCACHTAVVTNSEGLRKLIKKHDKKTENPREHLTTKLLPVLYSSSFYASESMLSDAISTLRNALDSNSRSSSENSFFNPLKKYDSEIVHQRSLESRVEELDWLKRLARSIPEQYMSCLVAHRGFHHIGDRNDKRPLENSTASFEIAWTSGIHLCECDIALTKDEKLILAHDESFRRLALDSNSQISNTRVKDLTFRELISLPLKSGVRPPLLIDVLRSAQAIADNARLIIEIKPGNPEVASALSRLLIRHPELSSCVAMVMSFDAVCMHRLREELSTEFVKGGLVNPTPSRLSLAGNGNFHRRLASHDHFGTIGRGLSFLGDPENLGLSLSQTNLEASVPMLGSSPLTISPQMQRPSLLGQHQRATSIDELSATKMLGAESQAQQTNQPPSHEFAMPELLLITVCEEPQHPSELRVGIENLDPLESWLSGVKDTRLDGVYLQYQEEMKTQKGAQALRELSKSNKVGVWMLAEKDPDDFETLEWLVKECGVSYVNTDLPTSYREGYTPKHSSILDDNF